MNTPISVPQAGLRKERTRRDGVVRVAPLMAIPALLSELGCNPEPLFERAGFKLAEFEDPEHKIPYVAGSRLLASCVEATGREDFGLLLGQRGSASSLGVAGFLLRTAPDVRTALNDLVNFLDLHDDGGVVFMATNGSTSRLGFAIHEPGVAAAAQIYDLSMTHACKIMRGLCGEDWRPSEVLLSRRPPHDPAPYEEFFQAPLRFDEEQSAVVFATHWLDQKVPGADALLHRHLEQEAKALHARQNADSIGQLRSLLRKTLMARKTTVADVARQLGLHERALNRRLHAEGTTFEHELNEVRFAVAQQLLADSMMSLAQISAALDYADVSAFIHAFKRWSGTTPERWRKERQSKSP